MQQAEANAAADLGKANEIRGWRVCKEKASRHLLWFQCRAHLHRAPTFCQPFTTHCTEVPKATGEEMGGLGLESSYLQLPRPPLEIEGASIPDM